jgi:hypothetical protein
MLVYLAFHCRWFRQRVEHFLNPMSDGGALLMDQAQAGQ